MKIIGWLVLVVYIEGTIKYVTEDSKQKVAIWGTLMVNRTVWWSLWHRENDHRFVYKRQTRTSLELQLHWLYLRHIVWQVGRSMYISWAGNFVVLHKCIRNQVPSHGHLQTCKNDEWMIAWDSISLVDIPITILSFLFRPLYLGIFGIEGYYCTWSHSVTHIH